MRIICLSDLHGNIPLTLPEGDLLLLAGDLCPDDQQWLWLEDLFYPWVASLPMPVVAVWGNHDFIGERLKDPNQHNVTFLHDEVCDINGLRIYGTPWSKWVAPWCAGWAFMRKDSQMPDLPPDVDVVMSHGPPYGYGDLCQGGDRPGSVKLRDDILRIKPKLVVCGHIHEDAGIHDLSGIPVVNASYVTRMYAPGNHIIVVNVE